MRDYTNTLLFESALDSITSSNLLLQNVAQRLFNPVIKIVEEDCGTLLGTTVLLAPKILGDIELDSGLPITSSILDAIAVSGASSVKTRTLHSCISKGGVCKSCFLASRPRSTGIAVNDLVSISPELLVASEFVSVTGGSPTATLPYSTEEYDVVYIYLDGILMDQASYSITGKTLTLVTTPGSNETLLIKFFVKSNVAFYYWLTDTYSGSLLGIKSILSLPLQVRPSLIRSLVNTSDIDALIMGLNASAVAGEDFMGYIRNTQDVLEKAIFVVALSAIFLNT